MPGKAVPTAYLAAATRAPERLAEIAVGVDLPSVLDLFAPVLFLFCHVGQGLSPKRRRGAGEKTDNRHESRDSHGFRYYRPAQLRPSASLFSRPRMRRFGP